MPRDGSSGGGDVRGERAIERGPIAQGLAAARANLLPGSVLWAVGLFVVLSYYFWPASHGVFARIGEWKTEYGFYFAAVSTAIFGGLLPFVIQRFRRGGSLLAPWAHLPFVSAYWAFRGIEVDLLYRWQSWAFGEGSSWQTVLPKVLVDQFIYCPLWAIPTMVLVYLWKDSGFSWARLRENLGPRWYYRRVVPVMVSNWGVWIPAVALIYLLPQPLQLPLQNVVVCFWVLLLMFLTANDRKEEPEVAKPLTAR
jgi:hypothetical protein